MPAERLQKLLAQAGIASRRSAEELIAAGRVRVNGRVARVGDSADLGQDRVEVDGVVVEGALHPEYYAVHKPRGFVSSARDERGRRSVLRLLDDVTDARLWPAGRLDVDSEGLMVLTNDGGWAQRVLHPRYGVVREYVALVVPEPDRSRLKRLTDGVMLDDGPARFLLAEPAAPPGEVDRDAHEPGAWLRVRVGEGRKREVRRAFAAVELEVQRLVRTRLGPLTLDGLRPGAWRPLEGGLAAAMAGERPVVRHRPGRSLTVTIDGPSGSGKSTVGQALARRIGATFVDTGLMYRALTLAAIERGIDPEAGEALERLADEVRIDVRRPSRADAGRTEAVLVDGRDVTAELRTPRIDRAVSSVSRLAGVRRAMLAVQRAAAESGDAVMVGRDIGTVVLPDATLKVYLTASTAVRAERRAREMGEPGRVEVYRAEIERRDGLDSARAVAPLRVPDGALVLDTGELGVEACVDAIIRHLAVGSEW